MDKGTRRSVAADRRGREEAGGTHRGRRNMVASEEASNGGGLVRSAPHSGVGPRWKPFGSQGAKVKCLKDGCEHAVGGVGG